MWRDFKTRVDFIRYLVDHPDERFWQAVRNFSGKGFVYVSDKLTDDPEIEDTFYWEGEKNETN